MIRSKLVRFTILARNLSTQRLNRNTILRSSPRVDIHTISPVNYTVVRNYANLPSVHNTEEPEENNKSNGGKMTIILTCTVCNNRFSRTFSKISYEKGIVIVECNGCNNNHLIADNLGWFPDTGYKNIEEILAAKGEKLKRIDGCWEIKQESTSN